MGFGMEEGTYDEATRRRNAIVVFAFAACTSFAAILGGLVTEWPMKNAIGIALLMLGFSACLWWMFASKRAGPLETSTSWEQWRKNFPGHFGSKK